MAKYFWVYILASKKNGTLYVGVTSDLLARVYQHKEGLSEFTSKYDVNKLVHFEQFGMANQAIKREKRIKTWSRRWKIDLIEKDNPEWKDLYSKLV